MKINKVLMTISFLAISLISKAYSLEYSCRSKSMNDPGEDSVISTTLIIKDSQNIIWQDHSHSAYSKGVFKGLDKAPYSPRKGELQFRLVGFYASDDENFNLSIPKSVFNSYLTPKLNSKSPKKIIVTEYFDNDDHLEQETKFTCFKSNL